MASESTHRVTSRGGPLGSLLRLRTMGASAKSGETTGERRPSAARSSRTSTTPDNVDRPPVRPNAAHNVAECSMMGEAMRKMAEKMKEEFIAVLPPTIFFFVTLHIITFIRV